MYRSLTALLAAGSLATAATAAVGVAGPAQADGIDVTIGSAVSVNLAQETVTLPLLRGSHAGQTVWYVVTDDSDANDARARGVNYSPKLANALGTRAVQPVRRINGVLDFTGTVDFSPKRVVVPGPTGNEFGGGTYQPGAVGDAAYSPLVTTGNGVVLNATQVANATGEHDSIRSIDYAHRQVTFSSFFGFWQGHRTVYLHQDASSPMVAAAEGSTLAPNLDAAPGLGSNDPHTSARSAIIPIVNGQVGPANPQRQGLNSALRGEGDPLNINQTVPNRGDDYSPVWDVHPVVWTDASIHAGLVRRLTHNSDVANAISHHEAVSAGTGPANKDLGGLRAAGFISNCPIVAVD
jgi:hypothetical protein